MFNKNFIAILKLPAFCLVLTLCLILIIGSKTIAQQQMPSEKVTPMTPMKKPQPVPLFETAYGEYFEMSPEILTIKYGTNILNIGQGQTQTINIPEGSPLLGPGGKLPATVEYTLRNKTTKNLKFRVGLRYGNAYLADKELTFFGQQTIRVQHNVNFPPGSGPLTILVEGTNILRSTSDDTRPAFFNGRLWVRVYPS